MAKIYTKTGDSGETSFYGGKRIPKHDLRLEVYGSLDELNSILGMARSLYDLGAKTGMLNDSAEIEPLLKSLQDDLFVVGSDLAAPEHNKIARVSPKMVERLEKEIDALDSKLPPLANFILPSGTIAASTIHHARTVCRRAERKLSDLNSKEKINPELLKYINRLSDLLFVMARSENHAAGFGDEVWKP
ncbi:MAG: cob(I)yrinic acid a,c-diamide adenosyltransferase [Candidatus Micrarchaeota archaeon]